MTSNGSKEKDFLQVPQDEFITVRPKPKRTVDVNAEFTPPDGGWGWVVCITSLWVNGTVFGILNTFGILYVSMREKYAKDDPSISFKTSWVGSVCTGMTFLMCMIASIFSDQIGIRKTAAFGATLGTIGLIGSAFVEQLELLYLTYGLILGLGSAFAYSPSLVILGHYFKKHMGLVNGIVTFGSAIFTIGLSLALPLLLEEVGLKYTFLFLSGLYVLLFGCVLTWKPMIHSESALAGIALSTESVYNHCNSFCTWTRKYLNVRIWRNRGYVVWALSCGMSLFGYFVPFVHLVKHCKDLFPDANGNYLVMCLSITSGVGRIVCGKLADMPCVNRIRMQQGAFAIFGVATLCIPFADNFYGLIAICLVMGLCDGLFICLIGPIAFDLVGPSGASQAIGFILGIFSVPLSVGPPLAGLLYDSLGSYKIAFHVSGIPPIVGALCMFFIPRTKQNYPAVTEVEEFAAVSVHNILENASDQDHRNYNGGGPAETELVVIKGGELLEKFQLEDGLEDYTNESDKMIQDDNQNDTKHSISEA
ncbi:monocarboxylate transporter 10 [Patella vulgata]|uniref:monocarboxylate transporter 10 n=1 Tax=Patella vulgata TaxID=6465 RepID=UPI00217FB402|nr:monocarboxylate transporter 10 [Patella vulgata]